MIDVSVFEKGKTMMKALVAKTKEGLLCYVGNDGKEVLASEMGPTQIYKVLSKLYEYESKERKPLRFAPENENK